MVLQLCVLTIFTIVQGLWNVEILVGTCFMWYLPFLIGTGLTRDIVAEINDSGLMCITD